MKLQNFIEFPFSFRHFCQKRISKEFRRAENREECQMKVKRGGCECVKLFHHTREYAIKTPFLPRSVIPMATPPLLSLNPQQGKSKFVRIELGHGASIGVGESKRWRNGAICLSILVYILNSALQKPKKFMPSISPKAQRIGSSHAGSWLRNKFSCLLNRRLFFILDGAYWEELKLVWKILDRTIQLLPSNLLSSPLSRATCEPEWKPQNAFYV